MYWNLKIKNLNLTPLLLILVQQLLSHQQAFVMNQSVDIKASSRSVSVSRQPIRLPSIKARPSTSSKPFRHLASKNSSLSKVSSKRLVKHARPTWPSVDECIADQFNYALVKGCLCFLFQSTGLSNGTFKAVQPFNQQSSSTARSCLIYTFVGDVDEIVRIEITGGNSPVSNQYMITGHDSGCSISLRLFTDLDRAELKQGDQPTSVICQHDFASLIGPKGKRFYSHDRVLIAEFLYPASSSNSTTSPFTIEGRYQFESVATYQSDGAHIPGTPCDRLFISRAKSLSFSSHRVGWMKQAVGDVGQFFSPSYPRNYPLGANCTYYFIGRSNERIGLELTDINLRGQQTCLGSMPADVIQIFDDHVSSSDVNLSDVNWAHPSIQHGSRIERLCGRNPSSFEKFSSSNLLVLTFTSSDRANQREIGQGFAGKFTFQGHSRSNSRQPIGRQNDQMEQSGSFLRNKSHSSVQSTIAIDHHILVPSSNDGEGILTSPNYPFAYPPSRRINYHLEVTDGLLAIKFLDFSLGQSRRRRDRLSSDNVKKVVRTVVLETRSWNIYCPIVDSFTVTARIPRGIRCDLQTSDRLELYDGPSSLGFPTYIVCGSELPKGFLAISTNTDSYTQSRELVSRGRELGLVFVSDAVGGAQERGFKISYRYVPKEVSSSTNPPPLNQGDYDHFAVEPMGLQNDVAPCQFVLPSSDRVKSGTLSLLSYLSRLTVDSSRLEQLLAGGCRWILLAPNSDHRIQLKLVQSHRQHHQVPSIQHDEQVSKVTSPQQQTDWFSQGRGAFKCQGRLILELVNYRQTVNAFDHHSTKLHNELDSMNNGLTSADRLHVCADDLNTMTFPNSFMSGNVPRLDVILRLEGDSIDEEEEFLGAKLEGHKSSRVDKASRLLHDLGYDIQYKVVSDYAVDAKYGRQVESACTFEFNASQSSKGTFSSPNYPGLYPIDLTCEYRFFGTTVQQIIIEFTKFDVESASEKCLDDRLGDYVEYSSCHALDLLSVRNRRFCHRQSSQAPYRIVWREQCLLLRFFSNELSTRTGFLGTYRFESSASFRRIDSFLFVWYLLFYFSIWMIFL